jgi:TonB-dependent starch-binding outer membrane protein SusC
MRHMLRTFPFAAVILTLAPSLGASALHAQSGTIVGRVLSDDSGQPLTGVQISVSGTGAGALTAADGRYSVAVPTGERSVRVEMIGYATETRSVTVTAGQAVTADFSMRLDALLLDAIVVTGAAGQARRREVGNAISQIDLDQIAQPVPNIGNLIQGRSTGVRVSFESAEVGAGPVIRLRGNVSVSQGNQPLVYVDGVRQATDSYRRGTLQKEPGPLNDINPADVARVEIIKGAAAATLYGSEAAAGVIQIFTKKGLAGDPEFTYQTDHSLGWVRPFGSEARPFIDMEPWLQTAYGQKHALSVTGGQERFRYFVSGAFEDREGVQVEDEQTRYSLRTNVTVQATDDLSFDLNTMFSRDDLDTAPTGNALEGIMFNIYRAPNNFVGGAMPDEPEFFDQIEALRTRQSRTNNQRQILGLTMNWSPLEAWTNRFTVGYDRMGQEQETVLPFEYPTAPEGQIDVGSWYATGLTLDLASNYEIGISEALRATVSTGGQLIKRKTFEFASTGLGLPGPGEHNLSSTAQRSVAQSSQQVNTGGFFVQGLLALSDRYFLTVGTRVDGNSAFGRDFGLEVYPKVGLSYVISDETFWPDSWGSVKLRGAFGYAGRAPGAFDAVRTWNASSFNGMTAFSPSNVGNPVLGPERTGEAEVGFDGTFMNDRLSLDFTYYRQVTSESLLGVDQAPSLGFGGSQLANVGKLKNTGLEIGTNLTVLRSSSLTWDVGVGVTTNHSEILDMGGLIEYSLVEGAPVPARRGRRVVNQDEFADPIYEEDYIFGPSQPTRIITGSMSFQLPAEVLVSARAEYQGGHWIQDFVQQRIAQQQTGLGALGCDDRAYRFVPHTEYQGPGNDHPNLGQVNALARAQCYAQAPSDVWFYRGDFAKLREITLRAPFPVQLPGVSRATVTLSAYNLLRWTTDEYFGQDPEVSHARDQTNSLQSIVSDQVPPPATFTLSLRAVF